MDFFDIYYSTKILIHKFNTASIKPIHDIQKYIAEQINPK